MRIVFVCTTNVWGSAMAELISRQLLAEWDPNREKVQVFSVGVRADVGSPMPASAQLVLRARGIDASEHRARWMSPAVLGGADLTMTMGVIQRDAALALNPRGLRSTFTVREAAALLRSLPPVIVPMAPDADCHSRAVVAELASARRFRSVPVGTDDLPDLIEDTLAAAGELVDKITHDVANLVRALVLPGAYSQAATPSEAAPTIAQIGVDA